MTAVPTIRRTVTRLADGRELIYFDGPDAPARETVDRRLLPPVATAPLLRYDALIDEWVSIAPTRQDRVMLPAVSDCPLCPSTAERHTEIPGEYEVVVFENRSPSFSQRPGPADEAHRPDLTPTRSAKGRCEVVCFTSDHNASFATLTADRVDLVMRAWVDRTVALSDLPGVEHVFPFENRGVEIGVTLEHPHGQIYAYPFVPPRIRAMREAAERYATRTGGRNLFADLLAQERVAGERVVAANEHWTAFVPAAARWPFEIMLAPHRRAADLPDLTDDEREAFAPVYLDLLGRLDRLFDRPMPYVAGWHQAPVHGDRELSYVHLRLFSSRRAADKLKYLAGSESAMGAFVNDIPPERAAAMLRAATA